MVFASSDRDEAAFKEYHSEMSFLALPYSERDAKTALSKKCKVSGIPSLCVFGPDGELITTDGRSKVTEDPEGKNFPWIPPTFEEILPATVLGKSGDVASSTFDDKHLMLYFSAHWCPPCRGFTPELVKVYNGLQKTRSDVELLFVSSDNEDSEFNEYYSEMPWLALKYEDRDAKSALSSMFEVEGIPSLVVLGPKVNGKRAVINGSARGSASEDNLAAFPWPPLPYGDLSQGVECNGSDINDSPAIVVLCEGADDDEQAECVQAIKDVATSQPAGSNMLFFYGKDTGGIADRIRELTQTDKKRDEVTMIKLDLEDNGAYYVSDCNDITKENIEKFMANPGERQQIQR
jgi:nucleoredoxin